MKSKSLEISASYLDLSTSAYHQTLPGAAAYLPNNPQPISAGADSAPGHHK